MSGIPPAPAALSKSKAQPGAELLHLVGTCAHPGTRCRRWAGCAWLLPGNLLPARLSPCAHATISVSTQHSCPWAQMARPGGDSGGKLPQCLPCSNLCLCPSRWIVGCRSQGKRGRGLSQVSLGGKEHLWFQPPTHSIHFSQCLPCSTQNSLVSLKSPKEPWGWAVFAILGEETDAQRVCQSNLQLQAPVRDCTTLRSENPILEQGWHALHLCDNLRITGWV